MPDFNFKKLFLRLLLAAAALAVLLVIVNLYIVKSAEKYLVTDIDDLEPAQAVMILGAATYTNGSLSPILQDRVDTALDIYRAGKAKRILVSGDNSTLEYNEVIPVLSYLIKRGVPSESVFLDYAGFNTYDSIYRSQAIFEVDSIILVTQQFHLYRAVFIASSLDLDVQGYQSEIVNVYYRNHFREFAARVKTFVEILIGREPTFLGEQLPITGSGTVTHE